MAAESLLPFQKSNTKQLIRIAECKHFPPNAWKVPDDVTALSYPADVVFPPRSRPLW